MCDKTKSKTQRHAISMTPKNWEFAECSESRKRRVFGCQIGSKLKKLDFFFPGGEYGEVAIKKITITSEEILFTLFFLYKTFFTVNLYKVKN